MFNRNNGRKQKNCPQIVTLTEDELLAIWETFIDSNALVNILSKEEILYDALIHQVLLPFLVGTSIRVHFRHAFQKIPDSSFDIPSRMFAHDNFIEHLLDLFIYEKTTLQIENTVIEWISWYGSEILCQYVCIK